MAFEITYLRERFGTLVTLIWHFPSVCPRVDFKFNISWECFIALTAFKWLPSSVCSKMDFKMSSSRERFVTLVTLIWFLPSVWSHMDFQIITSRKYFVTLATLKWFILCVCVIRLIVRWFFWEKVYSHMLHWNGFMPACILRCNSIITLFSEYFVLLHSILYLYITKS